jgi:ribosomal protein L29
MEQKAISTKELADRQKKLQQDYVNLKSGGVVDKLKTSKNGLDEIKKEIAASG